MREKWSRNHENQSNSTAHYCFEAIVCNNQACLSYTLKFSVKSQPPTFLKPGVKDTLVDPETEFPL